MADTIAPAAETQPTPEPPAPKKKKRWLLKTVIALFVLVLLLVVLLPTIASTAFVRAIVVSKVNNNLNGKLAIADWSIGWTSGIKADGIKIIDDAGNIILSLDHFSTQLPLTKAIRGNYALGKTTVDGLVFDAQVDADGKTNFSKLQKTTGNKTPTTESGSTSTNSSSPPKVSGDFELVNSHGTVSQAGKPTVAINSIAGKILIPDLNSAITDELSATMKVGDEPEGKFKAAGTAQLSGDGDIHQTIDANGISLAASLPFIGSSAGLERLAGMTDTHLAIDSTGGKKLTVVATSNGQNIAVAGPVLKGDTFATKTFSFEANLAGDFPDGLKHYESGRLTSSNDKPIALKFDQGAENIAVDISPSALLNIKSGAKPGSMGRIHLDGNFNLGALAGQLKNTMKLGKEVVVAAGEENHSLDVAITPENAAVTATVDIKNISGTNSGKPVSLQPIHLALGGSGSGAVLSDLKLALQSAFATADFHGNLANLVGSLNLQLDKVQQELSQFVDFGEKKYSGNIVVAVNNQGDLTAAGGTAKFNTTLTGSNLRLGSDAVIPSLNASASADLHRGDQSFIDVARNVVLAVQNGTATALKISLPECNVQQLTSRQINLVAQVDYDLAQLWPVVHPLLIKPGQEDQYKDLKITGVLSKQYKFTGSYPANVPFNVAIKSLGVDGGLLVDSLDYNGINIQKLVENFTVRDGKLLTQADAPAIVNNGKGDFANITADLTAATPRVSIPANKVILTGVEINPLFAKSFLAKFINNPLFAGAKDAKGVLDLTIVRCDRLPAGALVQEKTPENDGVLDLTFNLTNLHLGLQGLTQLAANLKEESIEANVKGGTVHIEKGIETQHVSFASGTYAINFDGSVDLKTQQFVPMTVGLPLARIVRAFPNGADLMKYVPEQAAVAMTGSPAAPQLHLDQLVQKALADAASKALVGKITGTDKDNAATSQPTKPVDILDGFLDKLQKDQDKKQQQKQDQQKQQKKKQQQQNQKKGNDN